MRVVNGFNPVVDNDLVTRQGRIALDLGQAGELKEGAIPSDFLLEAIDGGAI